MAFNASAAAAQQAVLSGRVTDAANGQPIGAVQIVLAGTNIGTQTNADGYYTIRNASVGSVTVRALRIGYAEQRQTVTLSAGQTETANFAMVLAAIALDPVVTTATGDQRRKEVGNSIAQVRAAEVVQTKSVSNVADLLTSRAPGVMVIPGTQTGAGVRVRIRGTSSMSLTNNPIYVIDGIRVEGATGSSSVSVGGTTPSRVGDLNPEEIESIEIVRGPSASTLYGTDAANGVIVIKTKRGVAGPMQWNYWTEQTALTDRNKYPTAYYGWRTGTTSGTTSSRSNGVQCFLTQTVAGTCLQDSVTSYNLHKDADATPYGTGYRQQHGLRAFGGSDLFRYMIQGEWEDEDGVTKVPEFDRRYLASRGQSLLPEQESPNRLTRMSGRANFDITLPRNADVSISAGYTSQDLRLPRSDDSGVSGIAANTYGGPGFKFNLTPTGDTLYGWRQFTPRRIYEATTNQAVERMISSITANWRPQDWLGFRSTFGLDYTNRKDSQICRFDDCPRVGEDSLGFKIDNRTNFFVYTFDAGATATRQLNADLESQTTAGVQFTRNILNRNGAEGRRLTPGSTTVTAGATKLSDETTSESRTFGGFLEQRVAFRDRIFVTGALRSDRNSAFGKNFKTVFYPKLSASWVLSDEPAFPAPAWLSQLRLRTAYGASGVQPGTIDALPYYTTAQLQLESGETSGLVLTSLGNQDLKPERSTELEVGVDASFWNSRVSTELTFYNKSSKDALVNRVLPPSLGTGDTDRLENVGEVRNRGAEALITARLIDNPLFGWEVTVSGSTNKNKLLSLGDVTPIITATQQQRPGYPLNGWWGVRLSWEDTSPAGNPDGIITLSEIQVDTPAVFLGYSTPRHEFAMTNGIDLWRNRVRLSAMVDYKGGHLVYNNTERIRCASRNNCSGLINPEASLRDQARTVLVREHPSRSVAGFFEDGDFVRLRELGVTFFTPQEWASRVLRGRSMTASLAVRNLGILWTKYTGVDPEAFGTTGDAPSEFQAFAPPTYFSLRLNVGF
jgi:TonB-linked SusC/RagA family outer membrane protein